MLSIPPVKYRKRPGRTKPRKATPPAAALTLIAAAYDEPAGTITLTFGRAIDIAGLVGSAIVVDDGEITAARWAASGTATLLDPVTVRIALMDVGSATQAGTLLEAAAGNGIVAADDGAAWAGVTELGLPFP